MMLKTGVDKEKRDDSIKKEIKNHFSGLDKNKTKADVEKNPTNQEPKPTKTGINENITEPFGKTDHQHAEGQNTSHKVERPLKYGGEKQANIYHYVYNTPVYYPNVYYYPPMYYPQVYNTNEYDTTVENTPEVNTEHTKNNSSAQQLAESTADHVKSLSQLFAVAGTFEIHGIEKKLEGDDPEKPLAMLIGGINHFLDHESLSRREREAVLATTTTLNQALQFTTENVSREEISQLAQQQQVTAFQQGWTGHATYGLILNRHRNLKRKILFIELNRGVESDYHTKLKNNKINSAFALKLSNSEDIDYTVQNAIYSSSQDREFASNTTYKVFPSYYSTFESRVTKVEQSPQHVGSCTGAAAKALTKLLLQVELGSRSDGEKLYDKLVEYVKMDRFVDGYLKTARYQELTDSKENVPQAYLDIFRPKFIHHYNTGKLARDIQLVKKITQRLSDSDPDDAELLKPLNTFMESI